MVDDLTWLQNWYLSQCNGDWEHGYGIEIGTLDNPGWRLKINLVGTPLEGRSFSRSEIERAEHDWVFCWLEDGRFEAACGPQNLSEAIETFRRWAGSRG